MHDYAPMYIFRLREIEMSEHDAAMYDGIASKVRRQIQALRIVLNSMEVLVK